MSNLFQQPLDLISEADFQKAVLEFAGLHGWFRHHDYDSRPGTKRWQRRGLEMQYVDKGFPDLVLLRPRPTHLSLYDDTEEGAPYEVQTIVAELKAMHGRESAEQRVWREMFAAAGFQTYLWWPCDWEEIKRVLE